MNHNFRLSIIEKDTGKNAGYIDVNATLEEVKASANDIGDMLGNKFVLIIGNCPVYESLDDRLDQIIELLKNRSKNE